MNGGIISMPKETINDWHEQTDLQVKKLDSAQVRYTVRDQRQHGGKWKRSQWQWLHLKRYIFL
jgi:hypothetical protein